jgi:hypothetical protein
VDAVFDVADLNASLFSVPRPDMIEKRAPLCHVKIDEMVQPDANLFSKLFEDAQACPLPTL